jgi:hypothetical protein
MVSACKFGKAGDGGDSVVHDLTFSLGSSHERLDLANDCLVTDTNNNSHGGPDRHLRCEKRKILRFNRTRLVWLVLLRPFLGL